MILCTYTGCISWRHFRFFSFQIYLEPSSSISNSLTVNFWILLQHLNIWICLCLSLNYVIVCITSLIILFKYSIVYNVYIKWSSYCRLVCMLSSVFHIMIVMPAALLELISVWYWDFLIWLSKSFGGHFWNMTNSQLMLPLFDSHMLVKLLRGTGTRRTNTYFLLQDGRYPVYSPILYLSYVCFWHNKYWIIMAFSLARIR